MNEHDATIREFLAESYENLDQLERDLVTIEIDPRNRLTLDRIFRTIHSVKGACGFLAYPRLEAVAHSGEGLLCRLRDGELEWRPPITSAVWRFRMQCGRSWLGSTQPELRALMIIRA